jgi:hypothetical protein
MTQQLKDVWERYVGAWTASSEAGRQAIFAGALARECVYVDPLVVARGWTELSAYIVSFQQQVPGGRFVTEQFSAHHGRSMARWKMLDAAGTQLADGVSFGVYDDEGRLTAMTGFFDVPGGQPPS